MGALVSAIITTHNRKNLLRHAIESVLIQTYQNLECIVVDDASTDGTKAHIKEYIENGKVRYIRISSSESRGGDYARNVGIKEAKGKYIAFLDDDDEWLKTKIERQIKLAQETGTDFVYCGRVYERDFDSDMCYKDDINNVRRFPEGIISKEVIVRVVVVTSTILIKRDLLMEIGMFDEKLQAWQEYELSLRALQLSKAAVVRENLVLYRILTKDGNRVSNDVENWERSVRYINLKHKELIRNLPLIDRLRRKLYIYIDGYIRSVNAGAGVKQLKYAFKIVLNPGTLIIAVLKKTLIRDGRL